LVFLASRATLQLDRRIDVFSPRAAKMGT
jgi:hypothetical protein